MVTAKAWGRGQELRSMGTGSRSQEERPGVGSMPLGCALEMVTVVILSCAL